MGFDAPSNQKGVGDHSERAAVDLAVTCLQQFGEPGVDQRVLRPFACEHDTPVYDEPAATPGQFQPGPIGRLETAH